MVYQHEDTTHDDSDSTSGGVKDDAWDQSRRSRLTKFSTSGRW